jgi:hypothetical protein
MTKVVLVVLGRLVPSCCHCYVIGGLVEVAYTLKLTVAPTLTLVSMGLLVFVILGSCARAGSRNPKRHRVSVGSQAAERRWNGQRGRRHSGIEFI